MNRAHAITMLLVLLGAVPVAVAVACVVSFFLLRAGYGLFVGAVLPFLAVLLAVSVLGGVLGRAAGGRGRSSGEGSSRGSTRGRDDV